MELKIGDRVTVTISHLRLRDAQGRIVDDCCDFQMGVEFDFPLPGDIGHDCNGAAKSGHGFYPLRRYITKVAP